MDMQARLIEVSVPPRPEAVVLVLHGGGSRRGETAVSPTQLSVVRMIPIARRIVRAGRERLAVFRLLNSVRGWDTRHTPVQDVRWALGQLDERFDGGLPTGLVGHSLGGRAALLAAGEPQVRSAVALAPWVYPTDVATGLAGKQLLIVHGSADRVARPENAVALAAVLRRTAEVGYICIDGGTHSMLRHHRQFDGLAAQFAAATLLGDEVGGPVERILAGEQRINI